MIALLLIFGFMFYLPTLFYGYVVDDVNPANDPKTEKLWWKQAYLEFRSFNYYNSKRAHLISLLLHLTVCFLIYKVFGSLIVSALFLVNPINYQGGLWLSGKYYTIAGIGALLTMLFPLSYLALIPISAFALLPVPFVFLMKQPTLWAMLPFIAFFLYWRKAISVKWDSKDAVSQEMRSFSFKKFIPYFKTFGYYTILSIIPFQLGMYHSFIYGVGISGEYNEKAYKADRFFFGGLALFAIISYIIIQNWGNPLGFGLFWWVACISQWCNFVTCQQTISERYIYTANIGLSLAVGSLISNYPLAITALLVYYITRNLSYRKAYIDDARILDSNILEIDDAHYAWMLRGLKAFKGNEFWSAYRFLSSAKFLSPKDFKVNFNLAQIKIFLKQYDGVEDEISLADKNRLSNVDDEQINRIKTMLEQSKNGQPTKTKDIVFCM